MPFTSHTFCTNFYPLLKHVVGPFSDIFRTFAEVACVTCLSDFSICPCSSCVSIGNAQKSQRARSELQDVCSTDVQLICTNADIASCMVCGCALPCSKNNGVSRTWFSFCEMRSAKLSLMSLHSIQQSQFASEVPRPKV
jgi:hypothetical protein